MRPNNNVILEPIAANANRTSSTVWAWDIVRASFQAVTTGTAAGNLQVQVSNDQPVGVPPSQFQPTNWSNLGTTVAVSGAGATLVPLIETTYNYMRVTYADTSAGAATGTIKLTMHSKGL